MIAVIFKGCMDKSRRYASGGSNGEVCGRTKKGQTHVLKILCYQYHPYFCSGHPFTFLALLWKSKGWSGNTQKFTLKTTGNVILKLCTM